MSVSGPTHTSNVVWSTHPCATVMGWTWRRLRWFQLVADGTTVTEVAELLHGQPARCLAGAGAARGGGRLAAAAEARADAAGHPCGHGVQAARRRRPARIDDGLAAVNELIDPETGSVSVAFQLSLGTWLVPDLDRHLPQVTIPACASGSPPPTTPGVDGPRRQPSRPRAHGPAADGGGRGLGAPVHPAARAGGLAGPPVSPSRTEVRLDQVADDDFVMLRPSWELRARRPTACAVGPASCLAWRSRPTTWPSSAASSPPASEWPCPGGRFRARGDLRARAAPAARGPGRTPRGRHGLALGTPAAAVGRAVPSPRDRPRSAREGRGAAYRVAGPPGSPPSLVTRADRLRAHTQSVGVRKSFRARPCIDDRL